MQRYRSARLLAVDPGLTSTGWAVFTNGILDRCGAIRPAKGSDVDRFREITHGLAREFPHGELVIELPKLRGRKEANPQAILRLATLAGHIMGGVFAVRVEAVEPRGWKGTIPKPSPSRWSSYIVHKRIVDTLPPESRGAYLEGVERIPASRLDVADAVGLGLWYLELFGTP